MALRQPLSLFAAAPAFTGKPNTVFQIVMPSITQLVLAVLVGALGREAWERRHFGLVPWRLFHQPCVDIYSGDAVPVVYALDELWTDADVPGGIGHGLAHITIAGAVHHGMRRLEVWKQTLAPGRSTPIHSHDCEEINYIIEGSGVLSYMLNGSLVVKLVGKNDTAIAIPGTVYQMSNTGDVPLSLFVYMGCAPANIIIYPSWEAPRSQGQVVYPMPWDLQCPPIVPPGLQPFRKKSGPQEL